MKPTLAAILARFDGDRKQAWMYCIALAVAYPELTKEYGALAEEFL